MRPCLFFTRSLRVKPPEVCLAVPWKTWALVPTAGVLEALRVLRPPIILGSSGTVIVLPEASEADIFLSRAEKKGLSVKEDYCVGMQKTRCIINLIGKHNLVSATQRDMRYAAIIAVDIDRIARQYMRTTPFTATSISQLYTNMKNRKNEIIVFPGFKLQIQHDVPIYPSWNPPKPIRIVGDYRNLYFQVRPSISNKDDFEEYKEYEIPELPVYPIATTDMHKVNLLEKYMY